MIARKIPSILQEIIKRRKRQKMTEYTGVEITDQQNTYIDY